MQPLPEYILHNLWRDQKNDIPSAKLISVLLTIAKIVTALQWKDSKAPLLYPWRKHIWDHFALEKLEFYTNNNHSEKTYNHFVLV